MDIKLKSRKVNDVLNRLHVTQPQKRDNHVRAPCIPDGVLRRMESMQVTADQDQPEASLNSKKKKTERDLELELEEDYHLDLRKTWLLKNTDERYDVLPEIYLNKNIADFIDPDIMAKLEELEQEEEARDEAGFYDIEESEGDEETTAIRKLAKKIRYKRQVMIGDSRSRKQARRTPSVPRPKLPFARERLESTMSELGIDMDNKEDVGDTPFVVAHLTFGLVFLVSLRGEDARNAQSIAEPTGNETQTRRFRRSRSKQFEGASRSVRCSRCGHGPEGTKDQQARSTQIELGRPYRRGRSTCFCQTTETSV